MGSIVDYDLLQFDERSLDKYFCIQHDNGKLIMGLKEIKIVDRKDITVDGVKY